MPSNQLPEEVKRAIEECLLPLPFSGEEDIHPTVRESMCARRKPYNAREEPLDYTMDDNASEQTVSMVFVQAAFAKIKFRPLHSTIEARLAFRVEHPGCTIPLSLPRPE